MKQILGFCDIGDIVVSLSVFKDKRKEGDLFKVLPGSDETRLFYCDINANDSSEWRLATKEEIDLFNSGITNINEKPDKEQLKVGTWYKFKDNMYAKFTKTSYAHNKHYFHFSEYIDDGQHKVYDGNWHLSDCICEANMSEIEPFLPKQNIQVKIGKTYVITEKNWMWIAKAKSSLIKRNDNNFDGECYCINIEDKEFKVLNLCWYATGSRSFRLATQDEINWLEACIREQKFVPKQKFIPGKWYKYTGNHFKPKEFYSKYSDKQDVSDRFYYDECINNGTYGKYHDWSGTYCLPVLVDLSEIQKYLPQGHPDKLGFVLPDKWCVQCTSNPSDTPELLEWRKTSKFSLEWGNPGVITYRGIRNDSLGDCTEITYEQFLKYVYEPMFGKKKQEAITETVTKKKYLVSELKYPMVVHITSEKQHEQLKLMLGSKFWNPSKTYYLCEKEGYWDKPYEEPDYTNIEFEDIIFPREGYKKDDYTYNPVTQNWAYKRMMNALERELQKQIPDYSDIYSPELLKEIQEYNTEPKEESINFKKKKFTFEQTELSDPVIINFKKSKFSLTI